MSLASDVCDFEAGDESAVARSEHLQRQPQQQQHPDEGKTKTQEQDRDRPLRNNGSEFSFRHDVVCF